MNNTIAQSIENLPNEILKLPRFLKTRKDNPKAPTLKDWQKTEKQKLYSELDGILGFVAATENEDSLIFFDFDHALNDNGEFINETAKKWFNFLHAEKYFCERSQSGKGLHMFGMPTKGKFPKTCAKLYFDREKKSFLEIFYRTTKFCLVTGELFHCEPNAQIIHGESADEKFQTLLNEINMQNVSAKKTKQEGDLALIYQSTNSHEYDLFRAQKMLDAIDPVSLSYEDWLAVFTACKTIGVSYSTVDTFNRGDGERYNEEENSTKWNEPINPSFTIETLHGIAKRFGYDEKASYDEWCELHPSFKSKIIHRPKPSNENEETIVWTQNKIKTCPANLKVPNNYLFGNKGITLVVPPKKEGDNPKYIPITRTPIIPTKIFREPKQNNFTYEIQTLIRGMWRTTEITGRTLADPRAIITLADSGALILEPKLLCRFLNDIISLNPDLNEIKAYNQPGWHDGKFIYPTGGKDYVVRRPGFNYAEEFATRGDPEIFKAYLLEALDKGGAVARIFFGTGLLATLIQPLNILNAQIQLNSKSGGGKTALAKMTAAIFGNPRELIRTFGATEKNRQAVAAAYNDLPTFFDEMETMNGKKAEEQLSQMIYSFAEGKGNQAQKRDGTAREAFRFYGARLMTAERPILKDNDLRGAYKRLIQIRCPKLFEDKFATDLHFIAENNFGHFGKSWTEYVTEHQKEIIKTFSGFGKIFATYPQNIEPTQLKSVTAAAVALQYFLIFFGVKPTFDDATAAQDIKAIITLLPTNTQLDDTVRAIESLASFVTGHIKSFNHPIKNSETGKVEEVSSWGTECLGRIFENSSVAFLPHALKKILEDELKFASADKLIAEWKEQGDILITDKERTTHKVAIGDIRARTIHFKARILITPPEDEELLYYEEMGVM